MKLDAQLFQSDRRSFVVRSSLKGMAALTGAAGLAGGLWLPRRLRAQAGVAASIMTNPFTLGVASGSPSADGMVLWTRLATGDLSLGRFDIPVRWELAYDDAFTRIAQRGEALARAELGHAVHVEVGGLPSYQRYYYRFMVGSGGRQRSDWLSPVGRTGTLPARHELASRLRIAYASCQRWEHGFYSAYRHMLADAPDLVLFLGDYIYEYPRASNQVRAVNLTGNQGWTLTLEDYRSRYALYKSDPHLQAMHAACPWLFTWDDHEVQNDYAGEHAGNSGPAVNDFVARRAAAYQAFYEHMPLRAGALTRALSGLREAAQLRLYGQLNLGRLGSLYLLDARQYKDAPVCADSSGRLSSSVNPTQCPSWHNPARSLLGAQQEIWLISSLARDAAQPGWHILGQPTLLGQRDFRVNGVTQSLWNEAWDGYSASRKRLTDALQQYEVRNAAFLGGDIHENWVGHVKADYNNPRSASLAAEFCGTSISSRHSAASAEKTAERLARNPHFIFANADQRGYGLADLSADQLRVSLRCVSDVTDPQASVRTLAQFVVQANSKPTQVRVEQSL